MKTYQSIYRASQTTRARRKCDRAEFDKCPTQTATPIFRAQQTKKNHSNLEVVLESVYM